MIMKQTYRLSLAALLATVIMAACNDGNDMSKEDSQLPVDSLDTRRYTDDSKNTIPDTATMKVDTMGTDTSQPTGGQPR